MTHSQQVLISLLKKSLFNFEAQLPNNVDWQEVFEEAKFQSVIPMVYDATVGIKEIPTEVLKQFKSNTIAIMFNNDKIVKVQNELCGLLQNEKINYAILKGLSVAQYYPKPELRTFGDIDVLVSKQDFDETKEFLIKKGFALVEEVNKFHCGLKKDDVLVELHFSISDFPETKLGEELKEALDNATKTTQKNSCLSSEFFGLEGLYQAVSLLLHIERHLTADGIGLRQLLDFGAFVKANPQFFDTQENVEFLKNFGLYRLAVVCNNLMDKFFLDEDVNDDTATALFEMSLEKGNFGVKRTKEQTYANFDLENENGNVIFKYFRYFKKRAKQTWPLARKHPWLRNFGIVYLPIRHVFRIVFKKGSRVDYKKILSYNNATESLYNDLSIFKR